MSKAAATSGLAVYEHAVEAAGIAVRLAAKAPPASRSLTAAAVRRRSPRSLNADADCGGHWLSLFAAAALRRRWLSPALTS